jgi:BASS family bile acid:Na+ symporter
MLLAAMPAGMTTPLLTEVVKGNVEYALALTVTTSLLAPLSIPLVLYFLVGEVVEVSFIEMFLKLLQVIVVPFFLAVFVKKFFHVHVTRSQYTFKPISLALLGVLIAIIIAPQAYAVLAASDQFLRYLVIAILFYALMHFVGYVLVGWKKHKERLTVMVSVVYMNFVLALYLAGVYFNEPEVVIPLVIQIIPWALMLLPFQKILQLIRSN